MSDETPDQPNPPEHPAAPEVGGDGSGPPAWLTPAMLGLIAVLLLGLVLVLLLRDGDSTDDASGDSAPITAATTAPSAPPTTEPPSATTQPTAPPTTEPPATTAPTTEAPPETTSPTTTPTTDPAGELAPGEAEINGDSYFVFNECFTLPFAPNDGDYQVRTFALLAPDTGDRVSIDVARDLGGDPFLILRYFDFETAEPVVVDLDDDLIEVEVVGGGDDNIITIRFRLPEFSQPQCDTMVRTEPGNEFGQYTYSIVDACVVTAPSGGLAAQVGLYLSEASLGSLSLGTDGSASIRLREYEPSSDYFPESGSFAAGSPDVWTGTSTDEFSDETRDFTVAIDTPQYRPCGEFEFILSPQPL